MPIHIAEATDEAVRLALLRHWCRQLALRLPPHEHASPEAAALADKLGRTLHLHVLLRGTRRLRDKARSLAADLAALGLAPPA